MEVDHRIRTWLDRLKESGYRLTRARKAVVEVLATSQHALNAVDIFDSAREIYPSLGLVSVYRTLEKLETMGLIQRVHHPDGCQAFIAGFNGHQHLIICKKCGKIEYFEGDNLGSLLDRVAVDSGYQVQEHWLQLFGLCKVCQR